jgi:integrase
MATVVERTTGRGERRRYVVFRVIDRDTGKERKIWELVPGGLKADALARKAQVEVALRKSGRQWPTAEDAIAAADETIKDRGRRWLEGHRGQLRDRVHANYKASLENHVYPAIGTRRMADVGPADAKRLRDAMREKGVSDDTVRAALVPLRSLVRDWAEDSRRPNPLAGLRLFAKGDGGKGRRKITPPEAEAIEALLSHARPTAYDAICVAAATGLRRGELFGLRWRDVDFVENVIRVRAYNFAGKVEDGRFKTDAGERDVPLFASIRRLLLERKARERFSGDDHFVFGTTVGSATDPNNFVRRELKHHALAAANKERAKEKLAPLPGLRWHDFRHYAVSVLIEQDANILLIARIAGHGDPNVTLAVYGHMMKSSLSDAAAAYDPLRNVSLGAGR